jgi:putative ABC transport system permease protein
MMVGGQIAMSLILLIASLLLVRSVQQLQKKDVGFDGDNVLTFRAQTGPDLYKPDPTRKPFMQNVEAALRKLPGVTSVSVSTSVPSKGGVMFGELSIPGRELTGPEKASLIGFVSATPEYIKTVGLRLTEGRFYTENEEGNPVVINSSWAKLLWPQQSALGKQFVIGTGEPMTIIGVVEDVATMGPATKNERPQLYTPFTYTFGDATFAVRTDGRDPASLTADVRRIVHAANPAALTRDVATLDALMADTISLDRFYMLLLGSFAGLALLLSVVGLYGVISNTVAQRTREIGVRMALGATPGEVRQLIFGHAIRIVGIGLAVGAGASMYLVKFLGSALHGFSAYDPFSVALAIAVLGLGAMFATWVPSRRAVRVDPLNALRSE